MMAGVSWETLLETGPNDSVVKHPLPEYAEDQVMEHAESMGRPVDMSKNGTWKAAGFIFAICAGDFQAAFGVAVNLVPFLGLTYHQPVSKAANITTNLLGSGFLLSVLGGFVADSYLGAFRTVVVGGIFMNLGLALLTFDSTFSSLEPPPCSTQICPPAKIQYMAPLYAALYIIALGTGLVRPALVSLGGEQFDESVPAEKKQHVHMFVWFYLFSNVGLSIAFTLGVYLQDNVSRGWGYGFALMFYFACYLVFLVGTPHIRRTRPTGSFLTRMAQVFVATLRKWKAPLPEDENDFYSPTPTRNGVSRASLTTSLRFTNRAAIMDEKEKRNLAEGLRPDPWRLCSVTQVEESKRLLQFLPIWASTTIVTLVFAQLSTFTVQQGMTMDRRLGPHFEVPSASLGIIMTITSLVMGPIYDRILIPILRRYTKTPYGLKPLSRIGIALLFACLTMITAALVERKRLTYVHELHLESLPLGAYSLPMKFWWLIPQYMLAAFLEFFYYVPAYELYYHETVETTRSVGSSFAYSSAAIGYFMSSVIVTIVNKVTSHDKGGSWLEGQLNNGGLENFYWLLAALIFVGELAFLSFSYFYEYKHDWYHKGSSSQEQDATGQGSSEDI